MIEFETTIKKQGNSLGVVIPKEVFIKERLKPGQRIRAMIFRKGNGRNVLRKTFGILKCKKSTEQMMREMDKELWPKE